MFKTRLDLYGNDFELFWNFEKFFDFFENFRQLDPPRNTGQKNFFWKIAPKHIQNTFGHFWERLWTFFWKYENFLFFLKIFEDSTLHRTLGKKTFSKKSPQNIFKTRLDTFGNDCGHFWNFESFWFFWKFSKTRPTMEHWAKKIFEIITPEHVQNTFGPLWERFWAFLEFWKVFWFFWKFSTTRPSKEHWAKKLFLKNRPKTYSKHVWTLLGTTVDIFLEIWNFFVFFWKFSKTRPSIEHWAKKLFRKNRPKTYSKHVWTLLGTTVDIFGILKVFDFFENFRRLDPPRNTGQKKFSK